MSGSSFGTRKLRWRTVLWGWTSAPRSSMQVAERPEADEGRAGPEKSYTLMVVRDAHEQAGYPIVGLVHINAVAQDLKADGFAEAGTSQSALFRLKNRLSTAAEFSPEVANEIPSPGRDVGVASGTDPYAVLLTAAEAPEALQRLDAGDEAEPRQM